MISMLSLILTFMLTLGGNPAVSVSPVNSINALDAGSGYSRHIIEKPRLGENLKIRLFGGMSTADKLGIIGIYRNKFEKAHLVDHYYYRNRYFLPRIGRFLQTDPMGYRDSLNLYQAFNNNPVNFTDPMGTVSESDFGFITKDDLERSKNNKYRTINSDFNQGMETILLSTDFGDGYSAIELVYDTDFDTGTPLTSFEKNLIRIGLAAPILSSRPFLKLFRKIFKAGKKITKTTRKVLKNKKIKRVFKSLKPGEVPFDLEKLEKIKESLKKEGVDILMDADAQKRLDFYGADASYLPDSGKPGVINFRPMPTRTAVIEELMHLGDHRRLKWSPISVVKRVILEISAQYRLIDLAKKLKWTKKEISQIEKALEYWYDQLSNLIGEL